jgi:S-methylmethionine-dependent homocysteine/selenocysteine methylase
MPPDPRPSLQDLLRQAAARGQPLILDGATGTALARAGVQTRSALWSGLAPLEHAPLLERIHREHVEAGCDIVTTCTFRTTRRAFRAAGRPEGQWRAAAMDAVGIARRAAGDRALVAGSIAPLEDCWRTELAPTGSAALAEHVLLATELVSAGVDILWLETFGTLGELDAATKAAEEAGEMMGIGFAAALTTTEDGSLLSGEPLEDAVACLRERGAAAISINCVPAWFVDRALDRLLACAADAEVGVYASLARAEPMQIWQGNAFLEPGDYAELAAGWVARGVSLIGACCGSTAEHVAALRARLG